MGTLVVKLLHEAQRYLGGLVACFPIRFLNLRTSQVCAKANFRSLLSVKSNYDLTFSSMCVCIVSVYLTECKHANLAARAQMADGCGRKHLVYGSDP